MDAERSREDLFEEVVAGHAGIISRIACSYESDIALRRELVQDIMLAIWVALPGFRGEAALRTFAASIAQKRAISHATRRAREPRQVQLPEDLLAAGFSPDEIAVRNDRDRHLAAALQRLPVPQREAIVLCLEGFSYGEVARMLAISVNAATLRCQRAKASLHAMMCASGDAPRRAGAPPPEHA